MEISFRLRSGKKPSPSSPRSLRERIADVISARVANPQQQTTGVPVNEISWEPRMPRRVNQSGLSGLTERDIPPTIGEWVQLLPKITPEQLRAWLLSAAQGNFYSAYSLFSVMEDTWVKLRKNLHEIREAVSRVRYSVQPFVVEGKKPSALAEEKADAFAEALLSFSPDPMATDECGFERTVYDLAGAMVMGVNAQRVLWMLKGGQWVPRATAYVFAPLMGFTKDRKLGVSQALKENDYWSTASAQDLDPDKYLVGVYHTRSGPCTTFGLLRPLAWWWGGMTYGRDWLFRYAQLFGQPIRWATYKSGSSQATIDKVEKLLKEMGSTAYAAFPDGVTMQLLQQTLSAADNPQMIMIDKADTYADLMILGQTLTSNLGPEGSGSGKGLGRIHADTKEERIDGVAAWLCNNPLDQLAHAWSRINYGNEDEIPILVHDNTKPEQPLAMAQRDQIILQSGVAIPAQWYYGRHKIPVPEEGDEVIKMDLSVPAPPNPDNTPPEDVPEKDTTGANKNEPGSNGNGQADKAAMANAFRARRDLIARGYLPDGNGMLCHESGDTKKDPFVAVQAKAHITKVPQGPSKLEINTTAKYLKAMAGANKPLADRVTAMLSMTGPAFITELKSLLDDFPDLAEKVMNSDKLDDAGNIVAGGMSASLLNAMVESATQRKPHKVRP